MKKQIAVAIGLAIVSTSAFATKARLEALGEDAGGSQFISDNRNVFLNPATINYHKDLVTVEWGDTEAVTDEAATPRAEGGFFKASGNMAYGFYLGSESTTSNQLRAAAMAGTPVAEQNNIDLFVGGDAGIQWGVNITYSSSKDEQGAADEEQDALRVAIGGISGDIEAFADIGVTNKADNGTSEFEGKSSFDVGASYLLNDVTYMARVQSIQAEDAAGDEIKVQNTWIGAAKTYRLNDKSNVWISGWYKMDRMECDGATSFQLFACGDPLVPQTAEENNNTYIPVNIALEVAVKEWLTLRGSVGQNLWGENDNGDDEATMANTTEVRAGASLVWGDFQLDGMVGNTADTNVVADTDTSAGNGTLRTDTLMSRVSMLYRF